MPLTTRPRSLPYINHDVGIILPTTSPRCASFEVCQGPHSPCPRVGPAPARRRGMVLSWCHSEPRFLCVVQRAGARLQSRDPCPFTGSCVQPSTSFTTSKPGWLHYRRSSLPCSPEGAVWLWKGTTHHPQRPFTTIMAPTSGARVVGRAATLAFSRGSSQRQRAPICSEH